MGRLSISTYKCSIHSTFYVNYVYYHVVHVKVHDSNYHTVTFFSMKYHVSQFPVSVEKCAISLKRKVIKIVWELMS